MQTGSIDNQINLSGSISDIRGYYVESYLADIGSEVQLFTNNPIDVYLSMGIVRDSDGSIKPVNVGLMFFSKDPEQFFPGFNTELTLFGDYGGIEEEYTVSGPLHIQIYRIMEFIQNKILSCRVIKYRDRIKSERLFNYRLNEIEEAVVSAFHLKDYETNQPVRISIHPDRFEITYCSVPDPETSVGGSNAFRPNSKTYRNNRVEAFLSGLGLISHRSTGATHDIASSKVDGSASTSFESGRTCSFTKVVIPTPASFLDHTF